MYNTSSESETLLLASPGRLYSLTSWVVFLSVGEITLSTAVYDTAQPAHMGEGAGSKSLQQAAQPP